jgi:glutamate-1-semialdehyde 2,1-aminomutase
MAEMVVAAFPSIEQLRMTSSGSEAVMGAIRLARAATGREVVVKTEGGYHGAIDGLLAQAGSGATTLGVPTSPGVPHAATLATRLVPYNDTAAAEAALEGAAAMIVEPVAGNMGVVPPAPGYLEALRAACDRAGALLILDEVITGFRIAYGGAQERFGVRADLTCLGKVIGAGLPVGAFGGRREIMRELAPEGPCYQAGTLSGNPLATAAGIAALGELAAPGVYERLEDAVVASGAPVTVNRVGSMLTPFFSPDPVIDYATATRSDTEAYGRFARALLEAGVYPPPSQYEAWLVGLAHGQAELRALREGLERAARA